MVNITLWKTVITITLIQKTEQKNSMRKAKFFKLCNKSIGFIYFVYFYCQFIGAWGTF